MLSHSSLDRYERRLLLLRWLFLLLEVRSDFCCAEETGLVGFSIVAGWIWKYPIAEKSLEIMAKTYGEKPIIFAFEENGEQYMIGSEVTIIVEHFC